jgi:hypothetical protein
MMVLFKNLIKFLVPAVPIFGPIGADVRHVSFCWGHWACGGAWISALIGSSVPVCRTFNRTPLPCLIRQWSPTCLNPRGGILPLALPRAPHFTPWPILQ